MCINKGEYEGVPEESVVVLGSEEAAVLDDASAKSPFCLVAGEEAMLLLRPLLLGGGLVSPT